MNKISKGFTLIELMIAVAIIAIIVAVAIPSYSAYVTKSRRSDAKVSLMTVSQLQETYFADNNKYAVGIGTAALGSLKAENEQLKKEGGVYYSIEGFYKIDFVTANANYYLIKATPVEPQLSDEISLGQCHTYLLDSRGKKTVQNATLSAQDCWN